MKVSINTDSERAFPWLPLCSGNCLCFLMWILIVFLCQYGERAWERAVVPCFSLATGLYYTVFNEFSFRRTGCPSQKQWVPYCTLINFCSLCLPKWTDALLVSHYIKKKKNWTHWFTLMVVFFQSTYPWQGFQTSWEATFWLPLCTLMWGERPMLQPAAWYGAGCWQFWVTSPSESWVEYCSLCPAVSLCLRVLRSNGTPAAGGAFPPLFSGFHFHMGSNPPWSDLYLVVHPAPSWPHVMCKENFLMSISSSHHQWDQCIKQSKFVSWGLLIIFSQEVTLDSRQTCLV